jgi:hypothetical protein
MWKLSFPVLQNNFSSNKDLKAADLFKEIGWDDLIENPSYENTCAIRMSLALIKSGMHVPGRMAIKKGPYKGKRIEMGQRNLSQLLAHSSRLGAPEKFSGSGAMRAIGKRSGIVSFWRLVPGLYEHGHIDIVSDATGRLRACASDCYWTSKEVWFWEV